MLLTVLLAGFFGALAGWAGGVWGGALGARAALKELRREFAELDADVGAIQQQVQRFNGRQGREKAKANEGLPDTSQMLLQLLLAQQQKGGGDQDEGFVGSWDEYMNRQKSG